jgi:hypothetical protein
MNLIRIVSGLFGAFIALLGLLWFLQGLAIIRMRPLLCVTNCEPIVGRSPFWAATGAIVFMIGVGIVYFDMRRGG